MPIDYKLRAQLRDGTTKQISRMSIYVEQQTLLGLKNIAEKKDRENYNYQIPLPNNSKCPNNSKHPYAAQSPTDCFKCVTILTALTLAEPI